MPTLFDDLPRPHRRVRAGIAHLPGWLSLETQAGLVREAREIARTVAGTPLRMQRPVVAGGQMSAYVLSLGRHWRTRPYGYVREVDGVPVPPLPDRLITLAQAAVREAAGLAGELEPWLDSYRPEAALVNYYPSGAGMGMHIDDHESSTAPIVSFSIGDEAVFRLASTESANAPFDDLTLLSGDAVVFGGPARMVYHGITRLNANTGPRGTGVKEGRINITIRQVDY